MTLLFIFLNASILFVSILSFRYVSKLPIKTLLCDLPIPGALDLRNSKFSPWFLLHSNSPVRVGIPVVEAPLRGLREGLFGVYRVLKRSMQ